MYQRYTATDANINSGPYRAEQRQPRYTVAERLAAMDRSLAELKAAGMEGFGGYRELQQQRDALANEVTA